jgi:hypothetical protein
MMDDIVRRHQFRIKHRFDSEECDVEHIAAGQFDCGGLSERTVQV